MGRRSIFSATAFRRIVSSYNAKVREEDRLRQIKSQEGCQKELPPIYDIYKFDFNIQNRIAHIDFIEQKKYRKIERYVTQNYVRYPIYGDWNTKTKHIKKTIKLTNEVLEDLENNDDDLICTFATEIIERIDNQDLTPSWFLLELVHMAMSDEKNRLEEERKKNTEDIIKLIKLNDTNTDAVSNKEAENKEKLEALIKTREKKEKSLKKSQTKGKNFYLVCILSFGIVLAFKAKKRIEKINKSIIELNKKIDELNENNDGLQLEKEKYKQNNIELRHNLDLIDEKARKDYDNIRKKYEMELVNIDPLPTDVGYETEDEFIPLKKLIGMNYEKIIGCYVIHNREFDKYYVGQSKDVMKRVTKDHFNGTAVKNIIFAEDYYNSKFENKDDIFEVKIIRLETKDELDSTEKALIEEYDSFNNGYNGTSGNK